MKRLLTATVLLVLGVGLIGVAQAGAEDPVVMVGSERLAPGDVVQVRGTGWTSGGTVTIELCGNDALDASADCDLRSSTSFAVRDSGEFFGVVEAQAPPRPCPCVIRVTSDASPHVVTTPVDFPSAGFLPAEQRVPDPDVDRALAISSLAVRDVDGWTSWIGAPAERVADLEVTNTGNVMVRDITVTVHAGRGVAPTELVGTREVADLAAGQTVRMEVPFELSALSFGEYNVRASISGLGSSASAGETTTTHPWLLYLFAALVLQLCLLWLRNRLRGRIARRVELEEADELLEIGPGEAVVDLTDDRELVLAGAPAAGASSVFVDEFAGRPPVVAAPTPVVPDPFADAPFDDAPIVGDAITDVGPVLGPPAPAVLPVETPETDSTTAPDTVADSDVAADSAVEDDLIDEPAPAVFEAEPVEPPLEVDAIVDIDAIVEADEADEADEVVVEPETGDVVIDLRDHSDGPATTPDPPEETGVDADDILRSATALTAAIRRDTDAAIDANRAAAEAVVDDTAGAIEAEVDEVRRAIAAEHDRAVTEARLATERLGELRAEAELTLAALRDQAERDRERAAYVLARAEREADEVVTAARDRIARMDQDLTEVHDEIVSAGTELRDRLAALENQLDAAALPDLADVDERITGLLGRFETVIDDTRTRLDVQQVELRARARVASVEAVARVAAQAASMANDVIDRDGDGAAEGDADVSDALAAAIQSAVRRSLQPGDPAQ